MSLFELIREAAPVALLIFDKQGQLVSVNRRWTLLTQQTDADAAGDGWSSMIDPRLRASFIERFMEAVGRRSEFLASLALRAPRDSADTLVFHLVPHRDARAELLGFVAAVSEVPIMALDAAKAEAPRQLPGDCVALTAKSEVEEVSRIKNEFLAKISHELRTPLNGIIGMSELLRGTAPNEEQREYLDILHGCAESLLGMVEDILDFSRVEAGESEHAKNRFRLGDSVASVLRLVDVCIRGRQQELVSYIAEDAPDLLYGHAGRLKQVLANLIGNASKFTMESGGILLLGAVESRQGDAVTLHFSVSDSGIGIPAEFIDRIFEPFAQVDDSVTRRHSGVGLGLSICRSLVALMGGRIWCESRPGVGSTFHFTANFQVLDDAARLPFAKKGTGVLAGRQVLIVQNNRVAIEHIQMILAKWGMHAVGALSGADALAKCARVVATAEKYQIALVDASLEEGKGFELAETLREAIPDMQILMLVSTENYYEGLRLTREHSFDGVVLKPLTHSTLLDAIMSLGHASRVEADSLNSTKALLSRGWVSCAADSHEDAIAAKCPENGFKVLVVEDNSVNQRVVLRLLEKHGYKTCVAWNGLEAEMLMAKEHFDAVLMDTQLPELSGLEVIRRQRLREQESDQHVPIISLTAHAMSGDREVCFAAGADEYVAKPIDGLVLLAALERIIRASRRDRANTEGSQA